MNSSKYSYSLFDITQWLVLLGAFSERWYELAAIITVNAIIVFRTGKLRVSPAILLLLAGVFVYSVIMIFAVGYQLDKFFQQFALMFIFTIGYYNFFMFNKYDLRSIFSKYLKLCYIVAFIGLIQFVVYAATGFNIMGVLYGKPAFEIVPRILRICSTFDEPSYFSTFLTPAIVYYLLSNGLSGVQKRQMYVIFGAVFLSFSSITYFIVVLVLVYKYMFYLEKLWVRTLAFVVVIVGAIYIFTSFSLEQSQSDEVSAFSGIQEKFTDTFNGFTQMDPDAFELLNLSSYATMTNLWVSINAPMRLTGTGLGTHVQNYNSLYQSDYAYYGLNSQDGYSLINRIFSEFGLIGIMVVLIWILYNFNKKSVINLAIAFLILSLLIRGGHYFRYGFIFYLYIYYYSNKINFSKWITEK